MLEPMERVRALLVFATGTVVAVCWLALTAGTDRPTLLLNNTLQAQTTTTNPEIQPNPHR